MECDYGLTLLKRKTERKHGRLSRSRNMKYGWKKKRKEKRNEEKNGKQKITRLSFTTSSLFKCWSIFSLCVVVFSPHPRYFTIKTMVTAIKAGCTGSSLCRSSLLYIKAKRERARRVPIHSFICICVHHQLGKTIETTGQRSLTVPYTFFCVPYSPPPPLSSVVRYFVQFIVT